MSLYNVKQVKRICAVAGSTLDRWAAKGNLAYTAGARERGDGRLYSKAQLFAAYVGTRYRKERANPDRVAGVVRYLSRLPLEKLEAELEAGRTWPVPEMLLGRVERPTCWLPGMLVVPPLDDTDLTPAMQEMMRRLDLKRLYREMEERVAELRAAGKLRYAKPGRKPYRTFRRR